MNSLHIYFSGIGGTGLGPLALIAQQAGYQVSGSDKQDSSYVQYLRQHGVSNIHVGQTESHIAGVHDRQPIDWFVYSSAVAIEQPDAPEFVFCRQKGIKMTKRDELLQAILAEKKLKLIAIAGTHGKTTTTAMAIWLFGQLGMPASYSVGAKLPWGNMGRYDPASQYFIYEADEFDRNFLTFQPFASIIVGVDYDHPDIYPTRDDYEQAFRDFIRQSEQTVLWQDDLQRLKLAGSDNLTVLNKADPTIQNFTLSGEVNRQNAWQVAQLALQIAAVPIDKALSALNIFPGVTRRFEQIKPGLYSDYAHTPPKIRGLLQAAHEQAGGDIVVVYEGLHNTRQHFIKDELATLFDGVKQLYIVPSYLARENAELPLLSPSDLKALLSPKTQAKTLPSQLDEKLKQSIDTHLGAGDTVVCISAGGAASLDEWLRQTYSA